MGISVGYNSIPGRAVIDVSCYASSGQWVGDEVWDFQIDQLQNGTSAPAFHHFPEGVFEMRPVTHRDSTGNAVYLSSLRLNPNNASSSVTPAITVWKIVPSSGGAASDSAPAVVGTFTGPGPISSMQAPLIPLQCANSTSCTVLLDLADTNNGLVQLNAYNSDHYFATSFSAAIPNSGASEYYVLAANVSTGTFGFGEEGFAGAQVSYSTATIDEDNEMVVNWTQFPNPATTPPSTGVDLWDYIPATGLNSDFVKGWLIDSSAAPYANTVNSPCEGIQCRWGDYSASIYDDSCAAEAAGLTTECDLFWEVTEYTTNPASGETQQNSNVTALYDTVLSNDTK
jgi:hypothetical protein